MSMVLTTVGCWGVFILGKFLSSYCQQKNVSNHKPLIAVKKKSETNNHYQRLQPENMINRKNCLKLKIKVNTH